MLWSVDSCQNRVSADQYCKTVSWAEVSTHWGWVFLFCNYLLTSYILLVFKWSQAQVLFLFFSLIFIFSRFLFLSFGLRHFKWEAQIYPGHPVAYHLTFWNSQCKLVHVLQCNLYRGDTLMTEASAPWIEVGLGFLIINQQKKLFFLKEA